MLSPLEHYKTKAGHGSVNSRALHCGIYKQSQCPFLPFFFAESHLPYYASERGTKLQVPYARRFSLPLSFLIILVSFF